MFSLMSSGVYFMVDFVTCQDDASRACVSVWKSEPVGSKPDVAPAITSGTETQTATSTFNKKSPTNGATNVSATSLTLSWSAYSPTPQKYTYCINIGSACADSDPDWTSVSGTSVTLSNLGYNKTYYWQVKAVTCTSCTPKTKVDADGGSWWKFTTKNNTDVIILGNAGADGAVLSYVNGTAKTVTANSTGAYSITVPSNWSGTITPSKAGYRFSPASASFTNVTSSQIIQNFMATPAYTITGKAGAAGVVLSYTDGTPKTVTSDSSGNYTISVPSGWSGTVMPASPGYSFSPPKRDYSNVTANQTAQDYTATFITYTISGNAGAAGVTVNYTNLYPGTLKTGADGSYSFKVPQGWSGTVTPALPCYNFSPANHSYTNVQADQLAQNFTATTTGVCVSSVLRAAASPTSAASVTFNVVFTRSVSGVDSADFNLTSPGIIGAAVFDVTGSGANYTVTVTTGSGNGTIRLNVIDNGTIKDAGNNPLSGNFTSGDIYTILKSPTFVDVTISNQYYPDIEVLYANGLTAGCSTSPSKKYCPDQIMDRGQAAVFVMRGNFGAGYIPNPATYQFQDDWRKGTWARAWAESMREAALTAGCQNSPLLYCPWQSLPREQLVIFALRLKYGNSYVPPAATGTVFADMTDPTYFATAWAEQAYKDKLIPACGVSGGKPLFCPKNIASRGLGAYMIVRAKNLITP